MQTHTHTHIKHHPCCSLSLASILFISKWFVGHKKIASLCNDDYITPIFFFRPYKFILCIAFSFTKNPIESNKWTNKFNEQLYLYRCIWIEFNRICYGQKKMLFERNLLKHRSIWWRAQRSKNVCKQKRIIYLDVFMLLIEMYTIGTDTMNGSLCAAILLDR